MGPNGPKWAQYGSKWAQYGPKWAGPPPWGSVLSASAPGPSVGLYKRLPIDVWCHVIVFFCECHLALSVSVAVCDLLCVFGTRAHGYKCVLCCVIGVCAHAYRLCGAACVVCA